MRIVDELTQEIFKHDSDFLHKLANEWQIINADFLDYYEQKDYEGVFLNILIRETNKKLPNYKVVPFVKLKGIPAFSAEERAENALGTRLEDLRQKLCWPGRSNQICLSKKCFDGEYPGGTEIDCLIIRNKEFCILEYENSRQNLRANFMKIYRLRKLLNKEFESIFVTRVTTTRGEGDTTFDSFNKYVDVIKPVLDTLVSNWKILEIVNLSGSERKRCFRWKPQNSVACSVTCLNKI